MRKQTRRKIWDTSINPIVHAMAGASITDEESLNILRKKEDGRMVIVGATRSAEKLPPGPEVPRLSDRPLTLPK